MNGDKIIMCLISPVIKSYSMNAKTEKQQNLALLRPNFSLIDQFNHNHYYEMENNHFPTEKYYL